MGDLIGLSTDAPFHGRSLAAHWRADSGVAAAPTSPAISEGDFLTIGLDPRRGPGPSQRGYTMSEVAGGRHYLRDGTGREALYDLATDPAESRNLEGASASRDAILASRRSILRVLTEGAAALDPEPPNLWKYRILLRALTPAAVAGEPDPDATRGR